MVMGRFAWIVVLGVLAGSAWAQDAGDDARPGPGPGPGRGFVGARMSELRVTGHGEVDATPDLAVVQVGANDQAKTAVDAQSKVNTVIQAIVEKIKGAGIPAEKIQSTRMELQPVYEERSSSVNRMKVTGYQATSSVRVEVSDLGKVGDIVDAAIGAGANNFEGISFQLKDDKDARADALKKAIADARAKAQIMADAAGVRLTIITDIAESSAGGPVYPVMGRAMAPMALRAAVSTPVSPGEVQVSADVVLTYRIAPAPPEAGK